MSQPIVLFTLQATDQLKEAKVVTKLFEKNISRKYLMTNFHKISHKNLEKYVTTFCSFHLACHWSTERGQSCDQTF